MSPVLALRLVFILGLVNALTLLALFFSCRCIGSRPPFSKLIGPTFYGKFYKLHCYYWIILGLSVSTHLGIAIWVLGVPI